MELSFSMPDSGSDHLPIVAKSTVACRKQKRFVTVYYNSKSTSLVDNGQYYRYSTKKSYFFYHSSMKETEVKNPVANGLMKQNRWIKSLFRTYHLGNKYERNVELQWTCVLKAFLAEVGVMGLLLGFQWVLPSWRTEQTGNLWQPILLLSFSYSVWPDLCPSYAIHRLLSNIHSTESSTR